MSVKRVLIALLVVVGALPGVPFAARLVAAPPDATSQPLRAEVQTLRPIYTPEGPLPLRFTLINSSDEPVRIMLSDAPGADAGITLPRDLITGAPDAPAIKLMFEDEAPQALVPAERASDRPAPAGELLLAPHAALGREFDLRAAYREARYPGHYRIEWQPLGLDAPPAVAEFIVEARKDAIIVTDHGKLQFTLEYEAAPRNVQNFLELVRTGFYDGKTFHRVIPQFIVQGGCPRGDGSGTRPDGKLIRAEFSDIPVDTGTLLMARKPSDPHSASCQFFIALDRLPSLDGKYTVIGTASGKRTLQTLNRLASVAVDNRDRPVEPLVIRSINLVDAEEDAGRTRRIQYQGNREDGEELLRGRPVGD